jgi:hypothetical protein
VAVPKQGGIAGLNICGESSSDRAGKKAGRLRQRDMNLVREDRKVVGGYEQAGRREIDVKCRPNEFEGVIESGRVKISPGRT